MDHFTCMPSKLTLYPGMYSIFCDEYDIAKLIHDFGQTIMSNSSLFAKLNANQRNTKKSPEAGWCASETMNHKGIYPQQQRYPTIVVRDFGCLSMCQQTSPWIHAPRILTLCFHAFWIIASRIIIDLCIMD